LLLLGQHWPMALTFDDLYARARTLVAALGARIGDELVPLASEILRGYGAGVVELHSARSPFVSDVGERPEVSAVARLQMQRGLEATNLRHVHCTFSEDARRLLLLLDGTRSRKEIAAAFWPGVPERQALPQLDAQLGHLARLALLVR